MANVHSTRTIASMFYGIRKFESRKTHIFNLNLFKLFLVTNSSNTSIFLKIYIESGAKPPKASKFSMSFKNSIERIINVETEYKFQAQLEMQKKSDPSPVVGGG